MNPQTPIPNCSSSVGPTPVLLSGSLDQYNAESLRQQLLGAIGTSGDNPTHLLLDMTAVEHIDASALQVLLACKSALTQQKLGIKGADASVKQWLSIAGADSFFEFLDTNG